MRDQVVAELQVACDLWRAGSESMDLVGAFPGGVVLAKVAAPRNAELAECLVAQRGDSAFASIEKREIAGDGEHVDDGLGVNTGNGSAADVVNGTYRSAKRTGHGHGSEEHTSELQSLMRISYAVFCLKKK